MTTAATKVRRPVNHAARENRPEAFRSDLPTLSLQALRTELDGAHGEAEDASVLSGRSS